MRLCLIPLFALLVAACDGGGKEMPRTKLWEEFSGANAFQHVERLVSFGPRPPGSPALEKARAYLRAELEALGWTVEAQRFTDNTPRGPVEFVNLIATFKAAKGEAVPSFLFCSHYDTKLFEDATFVGANDGGSSNGVLVELARVLAKQPELAAQVQLVFFDGEEAYVEFTETDGLYGSRHFAKQLVASGRAKQFRAGILFDMVGDRNLTITLSTDSPVELARGIFASAEALGVRDHFTYSNGVITDDHTPLNAIGIPVIDLIDFDFLAWHTPDDTMEQVSAESLAIVGRVALHYFVEAGLR